MPPLIGPNGGYDFQDRSLPPHMTRELAPARPPLSPLDSVGRRIALLFRLHPDLDREFCDVNLRKLAMRAKADLLATVESRLGIV